MSLNNGFARAGNEGHRKCHQAVTKLPVAAAAGCARDPRARKTGASVIQPSAA
ncbi:hypothetical protein C4K16_4742 [Pseudomonas chlororaphis subsp. aurantiaca]|nr:hypothetical protein C4K16_4742 [Pseudomonas chlororaphis subsp. aurantiaca]AZD87954.1 hypothetical protein C4K14_5152 [Pseudomonas chlororaphis subsp. aureofaciens]